MSAQPNDTLLEGLLADAVHSAPVPQVGADARQWPSSSPRTDQAIQKVAYNHEAMIDLILLNPAISQNAIAAHFNLTPSWVSRVLVSDAFQAAYAKRREQMIDPLLQAEVETNFKALVARSLDVLHEKLNKPADQIPDQLALRALEIGSRAAGYGARSEESRPPSTPAEVHIHLEQLGAGLIGLLQRKRHEVAVGDEATIEQITDVSEGG